MKDMNAVMAAYYLSPAVHMSLDHAAEVAWQNVAALKINYDRGAVYFARMNGLLARASNGTRSLDNIARTLIRARRERGAAWGRREYLALLSHELGEEVAHQEFETMFNGEQLVVPPSDAFGPCFTLRRVDKYPVDLGFPFGNPGSGTVIRNLDPGSRAALAGLREGDRIVRNTRGFWSLSDDYEMLMHMEVKRADGQEDAEIVYWPHGWTKVEAYEWVLQTGKPDCAT
jgi:predicted metalloprotease with PDZ domain